jgi:hypothetical protein
MLARRQLIEAAEVLAGACVRTVAFKGAAMIEQVYEQPGLPTLRHALLPGRRFMQDRYGLPGASLARLYLERTRTSVRIIMSRARQPASLVTDATLHRSLKHTMRR